MGRREKPIVATADGALPLGARMRRARQDHGVRLTDMARLIGYTKAHLSAVETGASSPSPELVQLYEEQLGLPAGSLRPETDVNGSKPGAPGAVSTLQHADAVQPGATFGVRESPVVTGTRPGNLLAAIQRAKGSRAADESLTVLIELLQQVWENPRIDPVARATAAGLIRGELEWLQREAGG